MAKKPLIWINAFPGVGKLTIAKILVGIFGYDEALLIDNHQLIDPVEADYSRDHPRYQTERKRHRDAAFSSYVQDPAPQSRTIIFTDCQTSDTLGTSVAQEFAAAARRSGRPFLPIYLECEVNENLRRLATSERANSGTTKLLDRKILEEIRARRNLYRFEGIEDVNLDVSGLTADEAAKVLFEKIVALVSDGHK